MNRRELRKLGVPDEGIPSAMRLCASLASQGHRRAEIRRVITRILHEPDAFIDDSDAGEFASQLAAAPGDRDARTPLHVWGRVGEDFESESLEQMRRACALPISVAAAMMPDAHVGYGLPIGGVLGTRGCIIPYAVGVDIACRMRLSVFDLPADTLDDETGRDRLRDALERQTRFGIGAAFGSPREHEVLDDDWTVSPVTKRFFDKARSQLGTSGSGNHFVEFGILTIDDEHVQVRLCLAPDALPLEPGTYLALMSHSGSRGVGARVCQHYSRLAMERHPELRGPLRHLAWLDLHSHEGQEYWQAMQLMGRYASANHAVIHESIARHLGVQPIATVENHHNFAWIETHDIGGEPHKLIVHRKGATPAARGIPGVIPGSMASPAFVVVGLGNTASLASAAHGAGRIMSRSQARRSFRIADIRRRLARCGVEVLSAGSDEVPQVYKDIHKVMERQRDLVASIARFDPRIVKMAPEGERAED